MPMGEIFFDEQARINGYVIDVEDPQFGKTQQAGIPYMTEPAPKVTSAAPRLNEHAGGTWSNKPRAKNSKSAGGNAPLAGLKVLDFGNFLAGPLAPMLMADLGVQAIFDIVKSGTKPQVSAGLDFFNTGVTLITDDPQTGVDSKDTTYGLEKAWG
jgi:hypothetical protein